MGHERIRVPGGGVYTYSDIILGEFEVINTISSTSDLTVAEIWLVDQE